MATLVPERREESTEYSSDLIDIEDDNPFLPHIPPPTAPPARPPLPPRDSPTGTDRRPSAPPSEILFSLEESDRTLSDLYLDDIYPSNPFAESTSTSTEGQRQTRDTGGGSASAAYPTLRPSPSSGTNRSGGVETSSRNPRNPTSSSQTGRRPSSSPANPELPDVSGARARGRSADAPTNVERPRQEESAKRPSVSPVPSHETSRPAPPRSNGGRRGSGGGSPSGNASKPKSPVETRHRSSSLTNGGTASLTNGGTASLTNGGTPHNAAREGVQGPGSRRPSTPPRTVNGDAGAAAAAAAAMAVASPPTRSGGGGSAAPASATAPAAAPAAARAPAPAPSAQAQGEPQGSWSWNNIGRLFGAMMGNALEGAQQGKKKAAGGRVARELSQHVMQQNPDGKYSVAVWKRSKQGSNPIQVSVGLYDTAYEAQRAADAYAPPIWQEPKKNSTCGICGSSFGLFTRRRHHCRNCGRLVCSNCSEGTWPRSMLPPTYQVDGNEKKVRICDTCCKAGERFRKALLAGSEEEAMEAYSTGCVNLRMPYTIFHNELPVHCAAAGGNLNILAWLVEDRCCPLFLDREKKVALGDSRKQSVMGAAAASGHMHIMRYLAFTQGCKVTEIKTMHVLWGVLEKFLYEGGDVQPGEARRIRRGSGVLSGGAGLQDAYGVGQTGGGGGGAEVAATVDDEDNMCIVCFEKKVDCTLVPCGHLCCCMGCAAQFDLCPVCRAPVEQKIRAIPV